MDINVGAFYDFWNAQEIEKSPGTNKLAYRVIGAYKFQFRLLDYRRRTQLGLRVAAQVKHLEPLFKVAQDFAAIPVDATAEQIGIIEKHNTDIIFRVLPDLMGLIGQPDIHTLMEEFVSTASVDRGEGKFEPLTDEHVADAVFSDDLTLQIPVAATAMEVNLAGFMQRVMTGFNSLPFATPQ